MTRYLLCCLGKYWGNIRDIYIYIHIYILGLYGNNGREHGNYYNVFRL